MASSVYAASARSRSSRNGERKYTRALVSAHDMPKDCWLIINGKVYDVSSWTPHHPGGNFIFLQAGKDSTQLFESYHPLYVRKLLEQYYVGEVEDDLSCSSIQYKETGNEIFYVTLKERVEEHLKNLKVNPCFHPHMLLKSFLVFSGYLLFYWITFFAHWNIFASCLSAIIMGFFTAQIGITINHDANHGPHGTVQWLANLMSCSLDFIGASSFMWRYQHVVGHHSYTNVDNYDPDIRVKDPDVRRVTCKQPLHKYHAFQHLYLGVLYGLLALKSVFLDDFASYLTGNIGRVKLPKMTSSEVRIFFGGKILYMFYMFVIPSLYSHQSMSSRMLLYVISQLVCGWLLAFLFQVAHVVPEVEFFAVETSDGQSKVDRGWAEAQVRTTANFSPNSLFWTHFSGGLNFQIEHHLFPSFCHLNYPIIHPIVKETCKEFNVPYFSYQSFWSALLAHFQHLKNIGSGSFELRLTG